ncbi:MAG: hypothetical protein L3J71_14220 [Victivallaceae bacterium]|nr:hypothetical protein [Victivallaceae bacterium]
MARRKENGTTKLEYGSVYQKTGSNGTYYYRYQINGQRKAISLKTKNYDEAIVKAKELIPIIKSQNLEILAAHVKHAKGLASKIKLLPLGDARDMRGQGLAVDTHNRKIRRIKKIFDVLHEYRDTENPFILPSCKERGELCKAGSESASKKSGVPLRYSAKVSLLNLFVSFSFRQTQNFVAIFPGAFAFHDIDTFKTLQNISFLFNFTTSFKTRVL